VNASKVKFADGQAMLSPLRFHYENEAFSLPVRLGLMNSEGTQDLIVHILAKQRFEVANYPNATIPTNIDVADEVRQRFGEFYAALFDATLEKNPAAVVTEYAWDSGSCDPCPVPALTPSELMTLGGDVLREFNPRMVLTRLHARYSKDGLGEDLVFKAAEPLVGGREFVVKGALETGGKKGGINNFQARYAIRHLWQGKMECENPERGIWGGPPEGSPEKKEVEAATGLAFAPRGQMALASMVTSALPELEIEGRPAGAVSTPKPEEPEHTKVDSKDIEAAQNKAKKPKSCGCSARGGGSSLALLLLFLGLARLRRRRSEAIAP
jgi:MYXO-CTERM domain-containing protein